VAALAWPGCSKPIEKATREETREATAAGVTRLEVRNIRGKVRVLSAQALEPVIRVKAALWARGRGKEGAAANLKKIGVKLTRDGKRAVLVITQPKDSGADQFGADLDIEMPVSMAVDVDTLKGDIQVLGVGGPVILRAKEGKLEARGIHNARFEGRVDRGSITASGSLSVFEASTKQGDVTVHLRGRQVLEAASAIDVGKGSILLTVPRDFNARVSAMAERGNVAADLEGAQGKGTARTGTLGRGGELISLKAGAGNVKLEALDAGETDFSPIPKVPRTQGGDSNRPHDPGDGHDHSGHQH
jgi:hypothetical protein